MNARMLVMCPLEIEARAAHRALSARVQIVRTGPGDGAIERALRSIVTGGASARWVVLFGVAGGLAETELAPRLAEVMDEQGSRWTAPLIPPGADPVRTVVGVDQPVSSPQAKQALRARTGADVVDCESHAFARTASELRIRWAVVRGVSDGPADTLPPETDAFTTVDGRTRMGVVALAVLKRPALAPQLAALGARTSRALSAAAGRLVALLDHLEAGDS